MTHYVRYQKILSQQVSRREFLMMCLGAISALIGLPILLGMLSKASPVAATSPGYGRRLYGP